MKRQHLLLMLLTPLVVFVAFHTVESIHRQLDQESSITVRNPQAGGTERPAPAGSAADPVSEETEVQFVFASEETAGELHVIVNKEHPLPETYQPKDLVIPNIPFIFEGDHEKRYLRKEAALAAEQLFEAAKAEHIDLYGVSGYRSYNTQKALYAFNVNREGKKHASRYSAAAGTSEHQTGLALDVTAESAGFQLDPSFADTAEGTWLAKHAHEYGFIIRYPRGKEDITGYAYEPWHLRYIGAEAAAAVFEAGLTLEEWAGSAALPARKPLGN